MKNPFRPPDPDGDRPASTPLEERLSDAPSQSEEPTASAGTAYGRGPPPTAEVPEWIAEYRILGRLGEGGMGVVFEAEQQSPRRRVAVKVIRGGATVDESAVRSFEREVKTLARLKHPGIGAIYESGRTEGGQHYFAMELVRGDSLGAYLADRPSVQTTDELRLRLALFLEIADAVHYAHQRGVIHRDLKPSNIIVAPQSSPEDGAPGSSGQLSSAGVPAVKILDFGLARITDTDVAAATMLSEIGVIKGTLSYMSPEQARGDPGCIDLRTDVYSLGVILYEMLTGARPYALDSASLVESVRVICDVPPRPLRQAWPKGGKPALDLETIVGKALQKDADQRYASVAILAEDVRRYLTSQPILARPPSTIYLLKKFTARNKALVAGVVVTLFVLVAGLVVSSVLWFREAAQRRAAEQSRAELRTVVEFQAEMLSGADPTRMGRRLVADLRRRVAEGQRGLGLPEERIAESLRSLDELMEGVNSTDAALRIVDQDILAEAGKGIDARFARQPLVEAELRHILGTIYNDLGLIDRAETQARGAVELRLHELGDRHPDTLNSMLLLAHVYHVLSNTAAGEQAARLAEAGSLYKEVADRRRQILGGRHPDTLAALDDLARFDWYQGRFEDAEQLYREALRGRMDVLGPAHPLTHSTMFEMACMYAWWDRFDQAESLFLRTLEAQRELGDDEFGIAATMRELARMYRWRGRLREAEPLLLGARESWKVILGSEHRYTRRTVVELAEVYFDQGRFGEAEPLLLETVEILKRLPEVDRQEIAEVHLTLGDLYRVQQRYDQAAVSYADARRIARAALGAGSPLTLIAQRSLADVRPALHRSAADEATPPVLDYTADAEAASSLLGALPPRQRLRAHTMLGVLPRVDDDDALLTMTEDFEAAARRIDDDGQRQALQHLAGKMRLRLVALQSQERS